MRKILECRNYFPRKGGITQIFEPAFVTAVFRRFRTGFFAARCDTKAGKEPVQLAKYGVAFFAALQISEIGNSAARLNHP
jgi:hypothetical protein